MSQDTLAANARTMPTRRRFITSAAIATGAAATGAATVAVALADPTPKADPTFAAIERHKAAREAVHDPLDPNDLSSVLLWLPVAQSLAHHEYPDTDDESLLDEWDALEDLLRTVPTTLAGARAALSYVVEMDRHNMMHHRLPRYAETLLKSPAFA